MAPILGLATFSVLKTQRQLVQNDTRRRQSVATFAAETLGGQLDRLSALTVSLADRTVIRESVERGQWKRGGDVISLATGTFPWVDGVLFLDADGVTRMVVDAEGVRQPESSEVPTWFASTIAGPGAFVSDVTDVAGRRHAIVVAAPVRSTTNPEKIVGVFAMRVRRQALGAWYQKLGIEGAMSVLVVDRKGNAVFAPWLDLDTAPPHVDDDAVRAALSGTASVTRTSSAANGFEPSVAAVRAVGSYGWGLVVLEPVAIVDAAWRHELWSSVGTYAVFVALFALLVLALIHFLDSVLSFKARETALDRQKTEFLSVASHQLRTPLTATKWFSELLLEDGAPLSPEQQGWLQQVSRANDRAVAIVNDLLDATKIEAGRLHVVPAIVDVASILDSVADDLRPLAESRNLAFIVEHGPGDCRSATDARVVKHILSNIMQNAVKYTADGGEVRAVSVRDGKFVRVSVSDSGIGIPRDEQELVFSKFFRAENARRAMTEGTGLGLYVSRSLTALLGGKLEFTSEPGMGTIFTFSLPVVPSSRTNAGLHNEEML